MSAEEIEDLAFTSAVITVEQPPGTTVLTVSCSISPPSSDGPVPAASVTGVTPARRSAKASSRCRPRDAKVRASAPSSSIARPSRIASSDGLRERRTIDELSYTLVSNLGDAGHLPRTPLPGGL